MPEQTKPAGDNGGYRAERSLLPSRSNSTLANFHAENWRPRERNTLRDFFDLALPSGLLIKEVMLHSRDDHRWIALPGKPYKRDDGTTSYVNIIDFADKSAKDRFQRLALAAVDALLGGAA